MPADAVPPSPQPPSSRPPAPHKRKGKPDAATGITHASLSPARRLALEAELASDRGEGFASDVLETNAAKRKVSSQDLGLAREITAGSLRCRRALDALIDQFLKSDPSGLHPTIRTILRQGAYQLSGLTRIPPHAAVDQAVDQARGVKSGVFKGLVNAVMRRVGEAVVKRELPDDGGHSQRRFLARVQRNPAGELITHWTELSLPIAPFFDVNPVEHLARVYNLPVAVVQEWRAAFGPERTIELLVAANALPALTVRLNPAALTGPGAKRLAEEQIFAGVSPDLGARRFADLPGMRETWAPPVLANPFSAGTGTPSTAAKDTATQGLPSELRSGEWHLPPFLDDFYLLPASTHPADLPGLEAGLFVVQDRAAGEAARVLDPQPGERILDLCAAPGGKTAQIAGILTGRAAATPRDKSRPALLIACDAEPNRLGSILDTAKRCKLAARVIADAAQALPHDRQEGRPAGGVGEPGVGAVDLRVVAADGRHIPMAWHAQFDAVLVDAPCSNLGVLHRRWEARWRLEQLGVDRLIKLQADLLASAAKAVKPGGRLVYTTCTLARAENSDQVARLIANNPAFRIVSERSILPIAGLHDGAYVSLLART